MREKRKNGLTGKGIIAVNDFADVGVTVFDMERKVALLKRCTHTLPFAFRNSTSKHKAFSPSADTANERLDQKLPWLQCLQVGCLQSAAFLSRVPKRLRFLATQSSGLLQHSVYSPMSVTFSPSPDLTAMRTIAKFATIGSPKYAASH